MTIMEQRLQITECSFRINPDTARVYDQHE